MSSNEKFDEIIERIKSEKKLLNDWYLNKLKVNDNVDIWIDICDCIPSPYCSCDKYWTIAKIVELDDKKFKYYLLADDEKKIIEEEFNFDLIAMDQIQPLTFDETVVHVYEDKEFWKRYGQVTERPDLIHEISKCMLLYKRFLNLSEDQIRKCLYEDELEILEKNYKEQEENYKNNLLKLKKKFFEKMIK